MSDIRCRMSLDVSTVLHFAVYSIYFNYLRIAYLLVNISQVIPQDPRFYILSLGFHLHIVSSTLNHKKSLEKQGFKLYDSNILSSDFFDSSFFTSKSSKVKDASTSNFSSFIDLNFLKRR